MLSCEITLTDVILNKGSVRNFRTYLLDKSKAVRPLEK